MKNQYKKAIWSQRRPDGGELGLDASDVNHLQQIYKKYEIIPETLSCVSVEFLLQRETLSRFIIKELDILLAVEGIFEIIIVNSRSHSNFFRSRDQVKYEFSLSTNGRYKLLDADQQENSGVLKLRYKKCLATLEASDEITSWSFGVISDGRKNDFITRLINSIINQKIPNFEIIICGPYVIPKELIGTNIILLNDVKLKQDIRPPTPAKKNKIIERAKYNNLCIMHDRFSLPDNWFSNFKYYGNYFDILCLPTIDTHGNRFRVDWMSFNYPVTQIKKQNKSLKYCKWSHDAIIQGGIIIAKKNLISKFMFDERLHWEELEDMQISKQSYLEGVFINIDVNNYVYSESVNHVAKKRSDFRNYLSEFYHWCRGYISSSLKFWLTQRKYFSKKGRK